MKLLSSADLSVIFLLGLTFFALTENAQEVQSSAISTELPIVENSSDLTPTGSIQFANSAGANFQRTNDIADLPETLVRFGLTERAEVRFMLSDELYPMPHVASFQSMDTALSVKVELGKANQILPRSAILPSSFPSDGPPSTSGSYDPSITAIWTPNIGKKYFVNEVAGPTLTTSSGARRSYLAPSVASGRSLTEALTAFAEYAPIVLPDGTAEHVADGGFALIHKSLTQFDTRAGYLKDSSGYHTHLSVGYSVLRDGFLPRFGWITKP